MRPIGTFALAAASLGSIIPLSAQPVIPGLDGTMARFTHAGNMEFDEVPGGIELTQFNLRALLPQPVSPFNGWTIQPVFDCDATILRFKQVPTSVFVDPENLRSFNVYPTVMDFGALALSIRDDSPWIYGAWADARLSTDFRHVTGNDFSYQFAAGTGYRFSDRLTLGIGGALTNPGDHVKFHPGIGLDWIINDQFRVGACGPAWFATYQPDDDWQLSLRGDSADEFWNISDQYFFPNIFSQTNNKIPLAK